ncbi:MAG: hypothetical protein EOP86_10410 [Verrucomicrobiaceae bacterium]|nr:MAG: hypothetical protein EOP86_10410 [Verrucomicrobiaceae bacterium]
MALKLEESHPVSVTLVVPDKAPKPEIGGEWRVFHPLISKVWTDPVGRTSWNGADLSDLVVRSTGNRRFIIPMMGDVSFVQYLTQNNLKLNRLVRGDGKTAVDPQAANAGDNLYLRNGDRWELTIMAPAVTAPPPVAVPPPAQPVTPPSQP